MWGHGAAVSACPLRYTTVHVCPGHRGLVQPCSPLSACMRKWNTCCVVSCCCFWGHSLPQYFCSNQAFCVAILVVWGDRCGGRPCGGLQTLRWTRTTAPTPLTRDHLAPHRVAFFPMIPSDNFVKSPLSPTMSLLSLPLLPHLLQCVARGLAESRSLPPCPPARVQTVIMRSYGSRHLSMHSIDSPAVATLDRRLGGFRKRPRVWVCVCVCVWTRVRHGSELGTDALDIMDTVATLI